MARKIKVKLILQLREAGMSRNAIASSRNISKWSSVFKGILYLT